MKGFLIKILIIIVIMLSIYYLLFNDGDEVTNKELENLNSDNIAFIRKQKELENKYNLIKEYIYMDLNYSPEYETRYNELSAWIKRDNVFNLDYNIDYNAGRFIKDDSGNRQYLMEQKIDSMQREIDHLKYNSGR